MKKYIAHICLFFLTFIIINYAFIFIYEGPKREAIKNGTHSTSNKWNDIQSSKNLYNTIILGSSRGEYAYNPVIIDSVSNTTSYNMCSGSQNIKESYYILKEILKYQKPEFVIFDLYLPSLNDNPNYYHVFLNSDFMSTKGKWDMIINGFGRDVGLVNILFPILKYIPRLKNDAKVFLKLKKRNPSNSHWIKGYLYHDKSVDSLAINNFTPLIPFDKKKVSLNYIEDNLNLINELCRENNIKLICVRAPYPPSRLKISYSESVSIYFKEFLNSINIPFYDLNYLSNNTYYDFDFVDYVHMNSKGAGKASLDLSEIIKARTQNTLYK